MLLALPLLSRATTVVPPDFDTLVAVSDYVVRATVKSLRSEWILTDGRKHIFTEVELEVQDVVAGMPPSPLVLRMLGGRIDGKEMVVQGAPTFFVGESGFFFIQGNGTQFVPLVALQHGVYPLERDKSGQDHVLRNDGLPLYREQDVARPLGTSTALPDALPLTAEQFTASIKAARASRHAN